MDAIPTRTDDAVLDDLRERLRGFRSVPLPDVGWDRGTDPAYLAELLRSWADEYDWRSHEDRLRSHPWRLVPASAGGFRTEVRLIEQRAADPEAPVVVLLHGWPDSFLRFTKVLPLLSDLTVVVPCLPGYPYSAPVERAGLSRAIVADLLLDALTALGHDRFVLSGGDVGSSVAEVMAGSAPDRVAALHLIDIPYWHLFGVDPEHLAPDERSYLARGRAWQFAEGAYALEQATKPHTLAIGLGDSPAGLAAWITEKLRTWSDCGGDVESVWSRDELLTWLTLYWVTGTIGSSFLPYVEAAQVPDHRVGVPTAVTIFPHDLVTAPRAFGERCFDIRCWDEQPDGGHFGAWERPDAFVAGIRSAVDLAREG